MANQVVMFPTVFGTSATTVFDRGDPLLGIIIIVYIAAAGLVVAGASRCVTKASIVMIACTVLVADLNGTYLREKLF